MRAAEPCTWPYGPRRAHGESPSPPPPERRALLAWEPWFPYETRPCKRCSGQKVAGAGDADRDPFGLVVVSLPPGKARLRRPISRQTSTVAAKALAGAFGTA